MDHGTVPHHGEEEHGASLMEHYGHETTSHGVSDEAHEEWGSSSSLTEEFPVSQ
jgi:hypothetical protein